MSDHDEWELASGLPLDGATVTITKAEFGYRNDIAQGTVFLNLTFTPTEGDEQVQSYSVGKGWEPVSKGAKLTRSDGRKGKINDSTNYGKLIAATLKVPGAADYLRASDGPFVAATWQGTSWVLGTVKETRTNPTTGVAKESSYFVPVEFLGAGGVKGGEKSEAKVADDLDADLKAALVAAAEAAESHDDFMAAAFEIEGVAGNQAAEDAVTSTGRGSIWARSRA